MNLLARLEKVESLSLEFYRKIGDEVLTKSFEILPLAMINNYPAKADLALDDGKKEDTASYHAELQRLCEYCNLDFNQWDNWVTEFNKIANRHSNPTRYDDETFIGITVTKTKETLKPPCNPSEALAKIATIDCPESSVGLARFHFSWYLAMAKLILER